MADLFYILTWWSLIMFLGLTGIPLSFLIFRKFTDIGYGFSKTLTILLVSYAVFLFSTVKILPFTKLSLIFVILCYLSVNVFIYVKNKTAIDISVRKNIRVMLLSDLLFFFGLFFWSYVRAHAPDINGLEKFMDFGFINSTLQTKFLPPPDMWYAGEAINYYWFGHYVTALLTKISGIPSGVTYNLMLATILGLSLSSSFSLVSTLINNFSGKKIRRLAIMGGIISAILLNFAGNFHAPYFILKNGVNRYWYPDATRFIGYNPDVNDKTIHEFPMYSYVVSDLHAHLLNLPFVLLFLALLYTHISSRKKWGLNSKSENLNFKVFENLHLSNWSLFRNNKLKIINLKNLTLLVLGLVLGCMFMTNAWDFANYLLVAGFVFLIYNLKKIGLRAEVLYKTAFPLIVIIVTAVIIGIPFILNFESIAQGIKLTHTKSPLWQLTILWGFPAIMSIVFFLRTFRSKLREDVFITAILIASWVLIALPEFIYVKDIYAETHYRANTMFKLTYQAFVMFYLSTGYITIRVIQSVSKINTKILITLLFSALFASILYYPRIATFSYYGNLKIYKGLSGETWLKDKNPDIYATISWLRTNNKDRSAILEAPGDSYTEYDSISSYTGFPTVSGWFVHEWLWRGSPEFPQKRVTDITEIYTSTDGLIAKKLLAKYNVKYVIIGDFEREKFPNLNEEKFAYISKVVFSSPTTKIYQINY